MPEPLSPPHDGRPDRTSFPDLANLFDGWFHQDFDIDGPDLETILPKYVAVSPDERVRGTIADIERFMGRYGGDDSVLREAVERVFDPGILVEGWEGMTTREWLLRVRELLEAGLLSKKNRGY